MITAKHSEMDRSESAPSTASPSDSYTREQALLSAMTPAVWSSCALGHNLLSALTFSHFMSLRFDPTNKLDFGFSIQLWYRPFTICCQSPASPPGNGRVPASQV